MSKDTQTLESQIKELTHQLETNSDNDKIVASTLMKRAAVYESLDQITQATNDIQTAIKRDPDLKDEAQAFIARLSQRPATTSTHTGSKEEIERIALFQKHLTLLGHPEDTSAIRAFVSSHDFVLVLTACGTPETPPRIKSLAFMILTRLFNPDTKVEQYPMPFIIEQCAACFSNCVDQGKTEAKLLAYRTLNAIFQTSMTVGAAILSQEGTVEEMMDVIEFEALPVQLAMTDVLIIASSDKSCQKQILKYAVNWLVNTAGQQKTDPQLKAAAGTALAKLRAQADMPSDDNFTQNQDADGSDLEEAMKRMHLSNEMLVESLTQVIKSKSSDANLLLNAVEGLAYSSLKPEIKAALGNDEEFLKCLSTLTISTTQQDAANSNPLLFGIGTIFANLTMYRPVLDEQQKQMKKLRDLANAKQNKPTEDDPRENDSAVEDRIQKAIKNGVALALMVLSKNSSVNIQAVAAQTYLQLVTPQSARGQLLQQGIIKALLPLSRDTNTLTGLIASQAMAKLAITTDPRIAFQGDTILDMVRPFLALCKDTNQLRQFEGLMALTNLASVEDRVRLLVENADGMTTFENLQLSNNEMVQRAATEMVCNMTFCDPVFERYSDPSKSQNRIRLLMILSDHEDPATRRAASGALAILANSPGTCDMIVQVDKCYERMSRWIDSDETADVQHRGIEVIRLLTQHKGKSAVDALVKENVDKKLISLVKDAQVQVVRSAAMDVLKSFVEHGVQLKP
ncbi:armadillo-type protein [Gilbertella persicaria]|uniref:armadillo-type protein n=1 Tax=Gilbertella persicaria TaxID=101096 RepID=UPI0022212555|nr:armadillo-type protein [Gilbertella persicaria]KAI8078002.1 armadillo-type protein [Gilbertella persicaria]